MSPHLPSEEIPLWPSGLPGGWSVEGPERSMRGEDGSLHLSNISRPRLTAFAPEILSGHPMIVVPGGGYNIVAAEHEGARVGEWLAARGHPAYVLVYRLPRPELDAPRWGVSLEDFNRALEIVRERHSGQPVTAMGFSAGGHLIATAATAPEGPNRLALIYPAYLCGLDCGPEVAPEVRPTRAVPTFAAISRDDHVDASTVARYAVSGQGPFELYLEPSGGHGYGLRPHGADAPWLPALERWLANP